MTNAPQTDQTTRRLNEAESPILRLFHTRDRRGKSYIDAEQLAAAERIRIDFEHSRLQGRMTMSYAEPVALGEGPARFSDNYIANLSDAALAARQRFSRALEMLGPELSAIVYHICCLASGLEFAEKALALPPRSGKAILAIALNKLARHYGFKKPQTGGRLP